MCIVFATDIKVNFESKSYGVRNKNKAKTPPKIRITYPEEEITSNGMFPIVVEVIVTNITAEGKSLHTCLVKCPTI